MRLEVSQTIAAVEISVIEAGRKSGLHRARCQVTPGRREPTESAAESRPPSLWFRAIEIGGKGERVR